VKVLGRASLVKDFGKLTFLDNTINEKVISKIMLFEVTALGSILG